MPEQDVLAEVEGVRREIADLDRLKARREAEVDQLKARIEEARQTLAKAGVESPGEAREKLRQAEAKLREDIEAVRQRVREATK